METLMIVGVDTMLGANLAVTLSDQFDVCGAACSPSDVPAGISTLSLGEGTSHHVRQLVRKVQPQWIVHAGMLARSSWEPIENGVDWADQIALASSLAAIAEENNLPHCFLSTDAVFSGPRLFHEEQARCTGMTPLAVAARGVELRLEKTSTLVIRTHAYGWSPREESATFLEQLWDWLANGQRSNCDGRHYATPILASDLARLLALAYARKLHGLYHVTGAERTNRLRFASELAAASGCTLDWQSPLPGGKPIDGASLETSLNTRRARRDLEVPMPLLREGLERLAAQRTDGYLDRLRPAGSPAPSTSHAA